MGLCYSRIDKTTRNETTATTTAERHSSGRCRKPRGLDSGCEIDAIQQVVGRLVGNGSSKVAYLYTQQGKRGTNQDAMLVWEPQLWLGMRPKSRSFIKFGAEQCKF